jgi:AcrR family transcriptional regulator
MARTRNPATHAVRRERFIDVAQRLITLKGYDQTSVQDVLDALDASRGAFYHYFDSKESLLEAVVERMADAAIQPLEEIVQEPDRTAGEMFEAVFRGIAQFKAERKDLVLAVTEVWLGGDNALAREKLRAFQARRIGPILEVVVRHGLETGEFTTAHPESVAQVLVSLIQAVGDKAAQLLIARARSAVAMPVIVDFFGAYAEAFERILGARPGSIAIIDPAVISYWFGETVMERNGAA